MDNEMWCSAFNVAIIIVLAIAVWKLRHVKYVPRDY